LAAAFEAFARLAVAATLGALALFGFVVAFFAAFFAGFAFPAGLAAFFPRWADFFAGTGSARASRDGAALSAGKRALLASCR
jgi:hypothetical protein